MLMWPEASVSERILFEIMMIKGTIHLNAMDAYASSHYQQVAEHVLFALLVF